jgi:hypothetical protein
MEIAASTAHTGNELAPRLPPQAPTHLSHLLQSYDEAVKLDAPASALRAMRHSLAFLLGHFTDLVAALSVSFGANSELFLREDGDTVSLIECEGRLREGLHYISSHAEANPLAKALVEVFFFESGEPRVYYVLTQGGKMGGAASGLPQLSEFCKEPRRPPSRNDAIKLRAAYLTHLAAWVEIAAKFWKRCDRLWERTSLTGAQKILYRFDVQKLEAGSRSDLHECKACIPSRIFVIPEDWVGRADQLGLPQEVPDHTLHLADRFNEALVARELIAATNLMRDLLEFLLRYFAGVAKTLAQNLDCLPDEARKYARATESVDNCEVLLKLSVEALLSQPDDPAARALVSVFYRRNESLEMEPRSHTDILLLEGVLSSWFKQERGQQPSLQRSARDFDRYYPLLRDWISSMGGYFAQTEHFDEAPTLDGKLPLTLRLGEQLLELDEPGYRLRIRQCPVCLPNPSWSVEKAPALPQAPVAVAQTLPREDADQVFPGEYRPLVIPSDAPKYYKRMLLRLDLRLRRGEIKESWIALKDCIDYLLRYWAGVTAALARSEDCLSPLASKLMESTLSVQDCERLLQTCLEALATCSSSASTEATQVFYTTDMISLERKPNGVHTRMLLKDANPENKFQLLAEFCEQNEKFDVRRGRGDLKTYLPVLRDWLTRSQPFFEQCIHHEEEPDSEGRIELVVQFDQDYFELVAPDYAFYIRPGSDSVPDLPVPEWVEPEQPVLAEEPTIAPVRRVTEDDLAMADPILGHKVAFVGIQNNSKGKPCKSGIIKIYNAGSGSLTGRAFSTHPSIEVSPARFRDNQQLTYWLDESSMPRDFVPLLVLRAGGDERHVTVAELRPLGAYNTIKKSQAQTLLALPQVIAMLIFSAVLLPSIAQVHGLMGATVDAKMLDAGTLDQILGKGQWVTWTLLLSAVLPPPICLAIYKKLPLSLQDLLERYFGICTVAGIPFVVLCMILPIFRTPWSTNKDLYSMNMLRLTPWFILFNLCSAGYTYLSRSGKIAEWVPDQNLRKLVPIVLFCFFIMVSVLAMM